MTDSLEIRLNPRSGRYDVPVPVAGTGRRRWVTTGARTLEAARKVVAESGVDRLVLLANAGALTSEAVSIVTAGRRVTCDELLAGWAQEAAGRWSDGTLRNYRTSLVAFLDHADAHSKPLSDVTRDTLHRFVNKGLLKLTARRGRMAAVKSFYRYARAHNYVLENLADTIFVQRRNMRVDQLESIGAFPLTEEEYRQIMQADFVSEFWKAVTAIAYWTGLRFVDCVCLEWASITPDFLIVWTKKRGKRVALPLDDPLIGGGELRKIIGDIAETDPVFVFPAERAIYLSPKRSLFPMQFQAILRRLGITWKSFHSTRHAAISRMARAGSSLESIGRLVGHGSTEQTAAYVHG